MTEAEYQTQKTALEAQKTDIDIQIAALDAEYTASVNAYPCWMYHETDGSVVVNSEEEATALGAGWTTAPAGTPVDPSPKDAKASAKTAKPVKASDDDKKKAGW